MSKLDDYINFCSESLNKISVKKIKINKTFYFDESNNIKKGIIGQDKDNNGDLENLYFVLGGIAVNGSIDFDDLLKYVGARQVPTDSKFSFFAFKKNKFVEAIKQSRLRILFEYLLNNKILIHFDVLHFMYFALTDVLDCLFKIRSLQDLVSDNVTSSPKDGVSGPMVATIASLATSYLLDYLTNDNLKTETLYFYDHKSKHLGHVKICAIFL